MYHTTLHTRIVEHEENFNQIKNEIKFTRLRTGFEKLLKQYLNKNYHARMCIENFPKTKGYLRNMLQWQHTKTPRTRKAFSNTCTHSVCNLSFSFP